MSLRVHKVKRLDDGSLEVLIHGGHAVATYVQGCLNAEKGVTVSEPFSREGMEGFLYLRVNGTEANPFTRERAIQMLNNDQQIEYTEGDGA